MTMGTWVASNSIEDVIQRQSQNMSWCNFICSECGNYGGGCICNKGVFIAFTGANMSGCLYFRKGNICPHCGKNF